MKVLDANRTFYDFDLMPLCWLFFSINLTKNRFQLFVLPRFPPSRFKTLSFVVVFASFFFLILFLLILWFWVYPLKLPRAFKAVLSFFFDTAFITNIELFNYLQPASKMNCCRCLKTIKGTVYTTTLFNYFCDTCKFEFNVYSFNY